MTSVIVVVIVAIVGSIILAIRLPHAIGKVMGDDESDSRKDEQN